MTTLSSNGPTADVPMRICGECGESRPVVQFRLERKGGTSRRSQCRDCHRLRERLRAVDRRSRDMQQFMGRLRSTRDLRRVQTVCNAMISRFGGLHQFVEEWHRQYLVVEDGTRLKHLYLAGVFQMMSHLPKR